MKRCAVFGASGGIGAALTTLLAAREDVSEVHALSRHGGASEGKIIAHRFDLLDESSIARACEDIGPPRSRDRRHRSSGPRKRRRP
jgi:uncharacterized protein YbjT (DUF2867 family)